MVKFPSLRILLAVLACALLPATLTAQQAAENGTPSGKAESSWRDEAKAWSYLVRDRAQTLYAQDLMRRGIEGSLAVRFVLGVDGTVLDCSTQGSSGFTELDALACVAVRRSSPGPALIDESGKAKPVTAVLPMRFVLVDDLPPEEF